MSRRMYCFCPTYPISPSERRDCPLEYTRKHALRASASWIIFGLATCPIYNIYATIAGQISGASLVDKCRTKGLAGQQRKLVPLEEPAADSGHSGDAIDWQWRIRNGKQWLVARIVQVRSRRVQSSPACRPGWQPGCGAQQAEHVPSTLVEIAPDDEPQASEDEGYPAKARISLLG